MTPHLKNKLAIGCQTNGNIYLHLIRLHSSQLSNTCSALLTNCVDFKEQFVSQNNALKPLCKKKIDWIIWQLIMVSTACRSEKDKIST